MSLSGRSTSSSDAAALKIQHPDSDDDLDSGSDEDVRTGPENVEGGEGAAKDGKKHKGQKAGKKTVVDPKTQLDKINNNAI